MHAAEDPCVVEKSSMIIISETETVQFSLNQFITLHTVTFAFLRANVGKYQESQISSKLFEFRLIYNPLGELFEEIRLRNPQALHFKKFGKVQKFEKNTFFYWRNCRKFQQFSRKEYKRAKAPIGLMLHMHLPVTQSFKTT